MKSNQVLSFSKCSNIVAGKERVNRGHTNATSSILIPAPSEPHWVPNQVYLVDRSFAQNYSLKILRRSLP